MLRSTTTLLVRSLREDSRLMRGHLLRLFLLLIILWALYIAEAEGAVFGAPGLRFFTSITLVNFLFISLAGVSYFATAITEEKEEMTLGLLKMAGVTPLAMLLGKSGSRLLTGLLLLSVQFPFTLLAVTLGGVTPSQIVATYCALAAYLLLVGNLGLFFSVACSHSRPACWLTGMSLGAFLVLPPLASSALADAILMGKISATGTLAVTGGRVLGWLTEASVFRRMFVIVQTGFAESVLSYQVLSNVLAGGALFGLSWLLFPYLTRNETPPVEARGLFFKRIVLLRWLGTGRAWLHNPLSWKDFHFIAGGKSLMLCKFVLYGSLVLGGYTLVTGQFVWQRFDWQEFAGFTMVVSLLIMMAELAVMAGRVFRDELQARTLPTVFMLPLTIPEIVYPKIAGCLLSMIPAASYFLGGLVLYPRGFVEGLTNFLSEPGGWFVIIQYVLFLHLAALLSLLVKWGAVPLAMALVIATNVFCVASVTAGSATGDPDALFVVLSLLGCFIIFILHMTIGVQLKQAAGR